MARKNGNCQPERSCHFLARKVVICWCEQDVTAHKIACPIIEIVAHKQVAEILREYTAHRLWLNALPFAE